MINLKEGVLSSAYQKAIDGFLRYSADKHALTYVGEKEDICAEPEFTGKYIDVCMKYFKDTGNETFVKNAKTVIDAIEQNICSDGYIGMLRREMRWKEFSVWNQMFTIMGLISYYRETRDETALSLAEKSASYIANHYLNNADANILEAGNYGTQNISILFVLPDLYRITKKEIYLDFMKSIIKRLEEYPPLNFMEFDDILKLQSPKAIENFVVLLSLLKYGELTGDRRPVEGAKKYWQQINDTQIRNTGNGSVHEVWVENGNGPMLLPLEQRPNETCVAVGWIELSLMLFYKEHNAKYLDAVEKTLFNHMLGAMANDGGDFAYYQPNFGEKIHKTEETLYKCCRYRGYTLFAHIKDMLYYSDESEIIPMIYQNSEYEDAFVKLIQKCDWPYDTNINFTVEMKKSANRQLKLRKPVWCENMKINTSLSYDMADGYIIFNLADVSEKAEINVEFGCDVKKVEGEINGRRYVSFEKGPLLLALDSIKDMELEEIAIDKDALLKNIVKGNGCIEAFSSAFEGDAEFNAVFRDYATAGRCEGEKYMVWIPVKE